MEWKFSYGGYFGGGSSIRYFGTSTIMKRTIDSFFKKRGAGKTDVTATTSIEPFVSPEGSEPDKCPSKSPKLNSKDFEAFCFERDPGLRQQIWNCPPNKRDEQLSTSSFYIPI